MLTKLKLDRITPIAPSPQPPLPKPTPTSEQGDSDGEGQADRSHSFSPSFNFQQDGKAKPHQWEIAIKRSCRKFLLAKKLAQNLLDLGQPLIGGDDQLTDHAEFLSDRPDGWLAMARAIAGAWTVGASNSCITQATEPSRLFHI